MLAARQATVTSATMTRKGILAAGAGSRSRASAIRERSVSGGESPQPNRGIGNSFVIAILVPSSFNECGSQLLAGAVRSLLDGLRGNAEHCCRLPYTEALFSKQHIGGTILL